MIRQRAIGVAAVMGILLFILSGCVTTDQSYPASAVMEKITGT
jgi:hypothetical protein